MIAVMTLLLWRRVYIAASEEYLRRIHIIFMLLESQQQVLAVWLSGNTDPVSTRMGDRLWTGKPSRYVTSQLGRLSLLPSVGR